jgi:glycosyltransferase involved in cell wall biosynthesis
MHPSSEHPLRGVIVVRLAAALRSLGHSIEFVKIGGEPGFDRYLRKRNEVRQRADQFRADIIHVHFGYSGLAVPSVRLPVITSFYGDDLNGTVGKNGSITFKSRLGIVVGQWIAMRSARCVTVSEALRHRIWFSSVRAKTVAIRDAIDPTMFRPLDQNDARQRLGLSPSERLVIFPHDVTQDTKRLWLANQAVDYLRKSIPNVRLWVVNGRPPEEMPWYYAAADAMIVTSKREGGPSSVKEALACGVPVVSVPVGDTSLFGEVPFWMVRAY